MYLDVGTMNKIPDIAYVIFWMAIITLFGEDIIREIKAILHIQEEHEIISRR